MWLLSYESTVLTSLTHRMATVWETFTEEQFFQELTLNLVKTLEVIPGVEDVGLVAGTACEKATILAWEQRHACLLPEDLKNFYLLLDGFTLTYNFRYAGELLGVGRLHVNRLSELRRYSTEETEGGGTGEPGAPCLRDLDNLAAASGRPTFLTGTKIFELDHNPGTSSTCLVCDETEGRKEIWLLDRGLGWHPLAPSFTQFFRMMLYHYGLREWELLHCPGVGLTPVAEQLILAVAPHLLSLDPNAKPVLRNIETQIDPNLFKMRSKQSKKNKDKKKYSK